MLWSKLKFVTGISVALSASSGRLGFNNGGQQVLGDADASDFECELPPVLDPSADGLPSANDLFSDRKALLKQVERHVTLVKIPSVSYDDSGEPGEDSRWDVFYELHATLASLYPFVHTRLARETVNTFGLVYTIKGQDPSLKPIMLTAHQDVVPIADPSTWKYPPFSAHFDGRWLWGRGASDDKNSLTAIFSALETLLTNPLWIPRRTIIVALGFDEESGSRGAGTIGPYLEKLYGKESIAIILDEGGMGLELLEGKTLYALPAVTEKGHVDVWLDLKVNGGHSSTPFPHTGIGIISEIVVKLEARPYEPKLIKGSPIYNHFACQAKYSPDAAPKITELIRKGDLETLAEELATVDRATQYRIQTSQAIDIISGGVKINALPEKIRVGVNHRIAPHNTAQEIKDNIVDQIKPIAQKYGLTVNAFESKESFNELKPAYDVDYNGTLTIYTKEGTDNAPISPTTGAVWDVFSGTIQHTFAFPDGKVVPVGELMTGNTDTRYYLGLTKNVYRWTPTRKGGNQNAHTVDEAIDMHAHMEAVKFYYDLVRNFDASDA
ncbi:peptidase family M20/M25/M40 [Xylariales sp. AK1849]|nr:peptidase family M20/M25/M40 [Xylariales sp. AK1849]